MWSWVVADLKRHRFNPCFMPLMIRGFVGSARASLPATLPAFLPVCLSVLRHVLRELLPWKSLRKRLGAGQPCLTSPSEPTRKLVTGAASLCLPACLPVCLSGCLSVWLSVSLSGCLSVSLSLSVCLAACVPACQPACLPACLSICVEACVARVVALERLAACLTSPSEPACRTDLACERGCLGQACGTV